MTERRGRTEDKIEALDALRGDPAGEKTLGAIGAALGDRSNLVVAKAAAMAEELELQAAAAGLVTAMRRLLEGGAAKDPQCWAKNALVKALRRLNYTTSELYLKGLECVQMEPVWGGQEDTAVTLRGECALALVQCRDLADYDVLDKLVEAWADPQARVRANIARAVGGVERREAGLLLKLKVLSGDRDPSVTGECFSALLELWGGGALKFIRRFYGDGRSDESWEALTALADSKLPEAFDELLRVIRREPAALASRALEAAAPYGVREGVRNAVREAVESRSESGLIRQFEREFRRAAERLDR